jgi:drug/metabolite transporter (DMT)-like permease
MRQGQTSHLGAVLRALLVTFLWSTSFVLVKIGLKDIPPFTFAGLRYTLAFLCLLPFALCPAHLQAIRRLEARYWRYLIILGLLYYTVTQGASFFSLRYLSSATISMLLNFTTIVVALMGIPLLMERPTAPQWTGVLVNVFGVAIYFYPVSFPADQVMALVVLVVGVIANAGSSILGRRINREGDISALAVTTVSIGVGAVVLLITGLLIESLPRLGLVHWAIIGWLAVVNTAFSFTLWNRTLQKLNAVESSIINNTMLIQVTVLSWLFLGESLTWKEIVGLALAGIGVLIFQLCRPQGH